MKNKSEKKAKTFSDELDEIIEMRKQEANAWKKIADSFENETKSKCIENRKK